MEAGEGGSVTFAIRVVDDKKSVLTYEACGVFQILGARLDAINEYDTESRSCLAKSSEDVSDYFGAGGDRHVRHAASPDAFGPHFIGFDDHQAVPTIRPPER